MSTSISIITDDSKIFLPPVRKWNRIGNGKNVDIVKNELKVILSGYNLNFPTNDLELEPVYKTVLKEYLRPAKLMYGGSFSEVRCFAEELNVLGNVRVYIISGRYGIVDWENETIPYDCKLEDDISLKHIDKQTNFSSNIKTVLLNSEVTILLLPKKILEYLLDNVMLEKNDNLNVAVCSKHVGHILEETDFKVFSRIGVTRLGKKNKELIIKLIKSFNQTGCFKR